jgi:hypothetical protein
MPGSGRWWWRRSGGAGTQEVETGYGTGGPGTANSITGSSLTIPLVVAVVQIQEDSRQQAALVLAVLVLMVHHPSLAVLEQTDRGGGGGGAGYTPASPTSGAAGNGGSGVVVIKIPDYQDRNIYWWRDRNKLNRWRLYDLHCYANFNNQRNGDILLKKQLK